MRKITSLFTVLMLLTALAFGQNRTITGTVTDEKGDPLPGASVRIKGSKAGVAADNNGVYRVFAKAGDVLLVSGAGLDPVETIVGPSNTINITVKRTVTAGTEVVVTALGIRKQPKELGYSITRVGGTEVNQARVTNLQNGLTGKVSGLNVSTVNNGVFGDTRITLRGIRSITGNNQPLLVVDGVPMSLAFINSINPNDIQDVNILKGNTGAAVYGQDGTNGVILVTTKKGSRGKPRISVSTSVQYEQLSFLPDLQNEFGAGESELPNGMPAYDFFTNNSFGPRLDGSIVPLGAVLADGSQQYVSYSPHNPARKFWNTGSTVQNDISFSGGDEKSTFLFSVQDVKVKGIVPKDENRRTTFRFNASRTFERFTIGFSVSYVQGNYSVVNQGRTSFSDNIYGNVIKTSPFIDIRRYKDWKNDKFAGPDGYYAWFGYNPYMLIDIDRNKGREDDFLGNVELSYKVTNSFNITYRAGTTVSTSSNKSNIGAITVTPWTSQHKSSSPWNQSTPASVADGESFGSRITSELFGNFHREFNKISVDALAGNSIIQRYTKTINVSGANLVIPTLYNISNRTGEPGASESNSLIRTTALFGKLTLGWDHFAFLEGTVRTEKDSRLNIDANKFFYPGGSVSLLLSEAIPAIKSSKTISYLKLRASYAKSGNVNVGAYALESTFSGTSGGFPYGTLPGFTANSQISNPKIKPEFVKSTEAGFELGLLKGRILLEATAYKQNNTNQVIGVQVSRSTGYSTALVNAAAFTNKGLEFDLKLSPLLNLGKNASIDLKMNYTYSTNKVTQIYPGLNELGIGNFNYAIVGQPAFVLKLIDWVRDSATGKVVVDNLSGLPSLRPDRKVMGRTLPTDIFGATLSVKWKDLLFSVVADYRGGNFIYSDIGSDLGFNGVSKQTAQYDRKPFIFPNSVIKENGKYVDNTKVLTPGGINWWTVGSYYNNETAFYSSANFWKIREVSVSYQVPAKVFNFTKIVKGISVTLTGRNLFTFLPKSNPWTDPEFSNTTGNAQGYNDSYNTPPTRFYGAAINVNF